ncbi:hypothetical protein DFH07DRAFT_776624 [Mycena maculata]|uniref:Uncharacterized protein n=1 Tax=Mycena maculata TaxID=230809 RepID=A0AAD7N606_9AGAR|nr:hypothetical protein DFH07DRAFT_776624 [Mycena maculata]
MLCFATIQVVLHGVIAAVSLWMVRLVVEGHALSRASLIRSRVVFAQYILLLTNNAFADGLFIYRCYVVWGRVIYIVILPIAMLTCTTILGYIGSVQNDYLSESLFTAKIAFIFSGATNLMLTSLTVSGVVHQTIVQNIAVGAIPQIVASIPSLRVF